MGNIESDFQWFLAETFVSWMGEICLRFWVRLVVSKIIKTSGQLWQYSKDMTERTTIKIFASPSGCFVHFCFSDTFCNLTVAILDINSCKMLHCNCRSEKWMIPGNEWWCWCWYPHIGIWVIYPSLSYQKYLFLMQS